MVKRNYRIAVRKAELRIHKHRIRMFICWRTTTQELERDGSIIRDGVNVTGGNGNGISRANIAVLFADLHSPASFEDVIDFLGARMIVRRCAGPRTKASFGQALLTNARIAM